MRNINEISKKNVSDDSVKSHKKFLSIYKIEFSKNHRDESNRHLLAVLGLRTPVLYSALVRLIKGFTF